MNKALTTPVSRGAIVMGKILQSVGRSIIQAVAVLLIGIALGMETSNLTVLGIAGTFVVIFLVAMGALRTVRHALAEVEQLADANDDNQLAQPSVALREQRARFR